MKILIEDDLQFHIRTTAQKIKFSINNFFSKSDQIADLVTFTGEILNGKLHFLCSIVIDLFAGGAFTISLKLKAFVINHGTNCIHRGGSRTAATSKMESAL